MTEARSFGTGSRESHDSNAYYKRKIFSHVRSSKLKIKGMDHESLQYPDEVDVVYCGDSRNMHRIPDNSVALIVTSPPYCVGKDYDQDLTLDEWLTLLTDVFRECCRVLEPGGRFAVNVANVARAPYIPYTSYVHEIFEGLGLLERGEIIWDKGQLQSNSCAWGSWMKASNPTLRDRHEYIITASKKRFDRVRVGTSTITRDEFMEYTQSIWDIRPESAKRVGHPAPFPVELPLRLIKLHTFEGDVVLDPFAGSGTTALAAMDSGRSFILYDNNPDYCDLARRRINERRQHSE